MSILVAGGAGYIGSHTARALAEQGESVIILDNLSKGHREAIADGCIFCETDLHDCDALRAIFMKYDIEAVIHFAAHSLVGESVSKPLTYYDNNVGCTQKLLSAMVEAHVDKIVFSSTAAVYGEPKRLPIQETDILRPTNPYGETKLAIERMLYWCGEAYGIRSIALRYFNAAGAHPSGEIGEDHSPETHLIPLILRSALHPDTCIKIFGTDYATPDGTCVRDYIHVCDLAEAHIAALRALRKGAPSTALNLGNGNGFSVRQVIEMARHITGTPIRAEEAPRRPGDPAMLVASSRLAMDTLGWLPKARLADIIESAWKFHKTHPNGFSG